jgi:hypothetical protein
MVLRYAFLWSHEANAGRDEGSKERPCAVLMTVVDKKGETVVTLLPVTHSPPDDPELAVELPTATKTRLGLDDERSWIVLTEANRFVWPGPDLRPAQPGDDPTDVSFGLLPSVIYNQVRDKWLAAYDRHLVQHITRTE